MPIYAFAGKKPQISSLSFVHPEAVIIGDASIGPDCFIAPGAIIRADFGPVRIGCGSSIQDNAVIHVSPGSCVTIGNNIVIAHLAALHDVTLHDRCVVGMGAILLQQVVCEEDAFIAAGSLVMPGMKIPKGKMAAGHPAKVIKTLTHEMLSHMAEGIEQYRDLVLRYRQTMNKL